MRSPARRCQTSAAEAALLSGTPARQTPGRSPRASHSLPPPPPPLPVSPLSPPAPLLLRSHALSLSLPASLSLSLSLTLPPAMICKRRGGRWGAEERQWGGVGDGYGEKGGGGGAGAVESSRAFWNSVLEHSGARANDRLSATSIRKGSDEVLHAHTGEETRRRVFAHLQRQPRAFGILYGLSLPASSTPAAS